MIFKYTVVRVLDGTQTQMRRPVTPRQHYSYAVGTTYTVQAASGKVCGAKIQVLGVREQLLGAMTEAEARAEGYKDLETFRHAWTRQYSRFDPGEDVWVVEFRLLAESRTDSAQRSAKGTKRLEVSR